MGGLNIQAIFSEIIYVERLKGSFKYLFFLTIFGFYRKKEKTSYVFKGSAQ